MRCDICGKRPSPPNPLDCVRLRRPNNGRGGEELEKWLKQTIILKYSGINIKLITIKILISYSPLSHYWDAGGERSRGGLGG